MFENRFSTLKPIFLKVFRNSDWTVAIKIVTGLKRWPLKEQFI